jgi:hypothetical protein
LRTSPARDAALLGLLAFFLLTGSITVFRSGRAVASSAVQPIAFNHAKHVKDLDLACSTCHQFYEKETFSGLPDGEVCASCHLDPQGKSAEEGKLVKLLKAGASPPWVPLFRQPAHVFYSHRRHVVVAKIECPTCHGSIADTASPPATVRKLRMEDCLDCHRRSGVSTDCTACHR